MSDYKGVGILFLRRRAAQKGCLEGLLQALPMEEDRRLFSQTMAGTWVPISFAGRAWGMTARWVYPELNLADGLRRLGFELAEDNLKGVYAFFARVLSAKALLRQTAALWRLYHRRGSASVSTGLASDEDLRFTIDDYMDLPEHFRVAMCGWVDGAVAMTGEKFAPVSHLQTEPGRWEFLARRIKAP